MGNYAANLLENLLLLDPSLNIVLVTDDKLPSFSWLQDSRVEKLRPFRWRGNNFLWSNLSLRSQVTKKHVDLLHSPAYTLPLKLPVPALVTIHDVSYAAQPQWYPYGNGFLRKLWYRAAALGADFIITDSDFSQQEILRVYDVPRERVCRIYCGIDQRRFRKICDKESFQRLKRKHQLHDEFLLYVGDIHPRRNVGRIIEAFDILRRSSAVYTDLQLVLAGRIIQGSPELRGLAQRCMNVRMLGYAPEEDLPVLYSVARAFLFPSFYEGFGLPVLEAMASGCPVIVSRGTACAEIAGDAGICVDPTDEASIAEAVRGVLSSPDVAARHSELGLKRAGQFSWRKAAEETLAVYKRIAREAASPQTKDFRDPP